MKIVLSSFRVTCACVLVASVVFVAFVLSAERVPLLVLALSACSDLQSLFFIRRASRNYNPDFNSSLLFVMNGVMIETKNDRSTD